MTPGEIFNSKRKNFIKKTKLFFDFLVSEYDFDKPNHIFSKQPNGTIILDKFEYENIDKKITVLNAYHPVDYGFEINLTENKNGKTEMLHFVLKENQDVEQSYLKSASEFLKTEYGKKLRGI